MKVHFGLPSCSYSVVLDKNDLLRLISTGTIVIHTNREPCSTSRAIINESGDGFDFLDRKDVYNMLKFDLEEPVADLEVGTWPVQFLNITLDNAGRKMLQNLKNEENSQDVSHKDLIKCSNYLIEGVKDGLESLERMTEIEKVSGYSLKELLDKFSSGWKLDPPLEKAYMLNDLVSRNV